MITTAKLTKVHLDLWLSLNFTGHFKVIHKFDSEWHSRGYFKVMTLKIACGVSCLRDGNNACHRTPNLIRWPWPPRRLIWRHESAIPATAGLLVYLNFLRNCYKIDKNWLNFTDLLTPIAFRHSTDLTQCESLFYVFIHDYFLWIIMIWKNSC